MLGEEDRERVNRSEIHIDFMIGSDELTVTGITADGERVPVLAEGLADLSRLPCLAFLERCRSG